MHGVEFVSEDQHPGSDATEPRGDSAGDGRLNFYAYQAAFMHQPSRGERIPWVIKTIGKIAAWPIVLGVCVPAGRPPTHVLYGPEASERLGQPTTDIPYHLRAFATKCQG